MLWRRTITPDTYFGAPLRSKQIVSLAYNMRDEFIAKLEEDLHEAAQKAGYDLTVEDSGGSPDRQLEQVESANRRGVKGILINLVAPDLAPALLRAAEGMKVIFLAFIPGDIRLLNRDTIFIGADQEAAGRLQGEWLAKYFKDRGKTEIRYILIKGIPNLPLTEQRTDSVLKALADNGITAIPAVNPIEANFNREEAMVKLLPVLRSGVAFDAIISNTDAMAVGAIQALEAQGMNPKRIVIVSIDATEPGIRALLEGKLDMTVHQNKKDRAAATITVMDNMLNGRPFDQGLEKLVSPENPYMIIYPFETVTPYHVPGDLYF